MILYPHQEVLKIVSNEALIVEVFLCVILRVTVKQLFKASFSLVALSLLAILPIKLFFANTLQPANLWLSLSRAFLSIFALFLLCSGRLLCCSLVVEGLI